MVDLGRLKSPLSDAELVLKMIRELNLLYNSRRQELQAVARKDFSNVFKSFKEELKEIEDVAEKSKVMIIRLLESIKSVEATLNSYRRNLKKRGKKEPTVKSALDVVESFLNQIRDIKKTVKYESARASREEGQIHKEAA